MTAKPKTQLMKESRARKKRMGLVIFHKEGLTPKQKEKLQEVYDSFSLFDDPS